MWKVFHSELIKLQNKHIPSKLMRSKQQLPWVSDSIKKGIRKKHKAHTHARKSMKTADWQKFKIVKRDLQKRIRQAYWDYVNDIVSREDDSVHKGFWNYIKRFKKDSVGISMLKHNGHVAISPEDKVEALNAQFSSVFTDEDTTSIPEMPGQPLNVAIDQIQVTTSGVEKLLRNLKVWKAAGPDGLPSGLLKELAVEIAPMLRMIFQNR